MIKYRNMAASERARKLRHDRVRRKIRGTGECPRLCVFRSLKYIYAQLIDDVQGVTLCSASSLEPEVKQSVAKTGNVEAASAVGKLVAARATQAGISQVVFDRGGYQYHGRIKALADGAREGGLQF